MTPSKAEVELWRQNILIDQWYGYEELRRLSQEDYERFIAVCHQLLQDPLPLVKHWALELLGSRGRRDDPITEAAALNILREPEEQDFALGAIFGLLHS